MFTYNIHYISIFNDALLVQLRSNSLQLKGVKLLIGYKILPKNSDLNLKLYGHCICLLNMNHLYNELTTLRAQLKKTYDLNL